MPEILDADIKIGYLKILDHLMMGLGCVSGHNHPFSMETWPRGIEAVPFNSWTGMENAIYDGSIHGGFLPLPQAMEMFISGFSIKLILFDSRPGTMVVSNKASGTVRPLDFKGKTVLISSLLSVYHLLVYRFMGLAGLKTGIENRGPADVFIEVAPPFMIPEMLGCDLDGDIGGCMVEEPFASRIIRGGYGNKMCLSSMLWPDHPHTALIMGDDVIKNNVSLIKELVAWLVVSSRIMFKNSPGLKRGRQKEISLRPDMKILGTINDLMVTEMGMLETRIPMDEFVDLQFALDAGA
ncbi:MAG: ABC transporter substrate-binding protein [Desulfamplus sp.]|nr:ABC transporter substrate-binding protein [Desulfamplus sp.]